MKYGGRLYISTGETREVILKISIPEDADNGDYYFTITFETDYGDEIIAGNLKSKAKIGSNILITVSGDDLPSKKAKIISFEAPKIVDGFSPITYGVTIENIGSTLFKPEGKIVIKNILGRAEVLTLAPQNILASSKRNIYCLDGEKLISCTLNIKNKLPFGIYRATLIFNPDGEDQTYEEEAVTLVLPATYIAVIFILIIILKKIFRKTSNVK